MSEAERLDEAAWRAGVEVVAMDEAAWRAAPPVRRRSGARGRLGAWESPVARVEAGAETPSGWRVAGRLELLEAEGDGELWALVAPAGGPLAFVSMQRWGDGSPELRSAAEVEGIIADRRAMAMEAVAFMRGVAASGARGRVRPAADARTLRDRERRAARERGDGDG